MGDDQTLQLQAEAKLAVQSAMGENGTQQQQTPQTSPPAPAEVKVYRRRWVMLGLWVLVTCLNSVPWMQYTIIADKAKKYYDVDNLTIEWTTMVYSALAMVLIMPAAWVLDKYGLRASVLLGAAGTSVGLWLKTLGSQSDKFWVALLGQAFVAFSTNFVVSAAPPRMAAVWFPPDEVATAVGLPLLATMLGVAAGCVLAALSSQGTSDKAEMYESFFTTNLSLAIIGTLLLIAVLIFFQSSPPLPPSASQAAQAARAPNSAGAFLSFFRSLRRICRDPHFVLLLIGCTLFSSTFIAFTTLLNRAITTFFPDRGSDAGWIGMLITVAGMVGIILVSLILDRLRYYKEAAVIILCFALLSAISYCVVLSRSDSITALYVVTGIMGFFMPCFYVPGFALAVELTYPEPEGNPTAIINWLIQPTALLVTFAYGRFFTLWGADVAHAVQCAQLALGLACISAVPKKYKRREAELKPEREMQKLTAVD